MKKAIAIGAAWGVVVAVLPFELFFFGAVLWLPFLVVTVYRLGVGKRGYAMGALILVVAAGMAHPNSYDHRRFGPFPKKEATLAELRAVGVVFVPPGHDSDLIRLPSVNPTKLEIRDAITNQTDLHTFLWHCGSGASLYSGGVSGPISLSEKKE